VTGVDKSNTRVPTDGVLTVGGSDLRHGVLTIPEVLAQSVANMAPSAAMALLPLLVFLNAGNGSWLSFVIALVLMLFVGVCITQFAKRTNASGSFYSWVRGSLGVGAGHTAGGALLLGYIATGMACVLGFGIYGADLLTRLGLGTGVSYVQVALYVVDLIGAVLVAISDVRISVRTSMVLEAISVAAILAICGAVYFERGAVVDPAQISLRGSGLGGITVGVVLAIFAFVGFESAGSLGREARNPERSIGRAILWSCGLVGLFYVFVVYTQVYGFSGTESGFAKSTAPLPDLADVVHLPVLAPIVDLGIVCSMFACTLACVNAASRVLFAMAQDRLAPRRLARVHRRHHTPHVSMWTVGVPMLLVPAVFLLLGNDAISLSGWIGTVAVFGFMLGYCLAAVGAAWFLRTRGEPSTLITLLAVISVAAMVFVFWANWIPQYPANGVFPGLTAPYDALPYVFLGWVACSLLWYAVVRRRAANRAAPRAFP
jgi:amino acid transporter